MPVKKVAPKRNQPKRRPAAKVAQYDEHPDIPPAAWDRFTEHKKFHQLMDEEEGVDDSTTALVSRDTLQELRDRIVALDKHFVGVNVVEVAVIRADVMDIIYGVLDPSSELELEV
jgi:hypothetical protein